MKDKLGDFPPLSTLSICHWKQKTETKCHNCVFPVTRKLLPQFFSHVNELFLITHLFYRLVSLIMLQFIYVMCFKPTILLLETLVILAFSLLKVAVHLQATLEPTSSHRCLLHVLLGSVLHTKDKYKLCTEFKKTQPSPGWTEWLSNNPHTYTKKEKQHQIKSVGLVLRWTKLDLDHREHLFYFDHPP